MKTLLLLFSFLKLGKVFTTGATMMISIAAYAFIYGWAYAVGFVGLIFVHEMGHYLAAKHRGLNVGVPVFIPFVGAWIELKEMPHNAETEAYVGLAGPLIGTVGALACYFAARELNSNLLLAISYAGFFINLFNLIPLPPFDGGRVTAVLSPRLWLIGVPILIALFFYRPSPVLVMMAIIALPQVWHSLKKKPESVEDEENGDSQPDYYEASLETRLMYGAYYIGLIGFLAIMANGVHEMLESVHLVSGR